MTDPLSMFAPIAEVLLALRMPLLIYFGGFLLLHLMIELVRALIKEIKASVKEARYKRSDLAAVDQMSGLDFEKYLAYVFRRAGFGVQLTPPSGDFGVDLILEHPTTAERIAVQAKRWANPVGIRSVQEVHLGRTYYQCSKAIVVTNSEFTEAALEAAGVCGVTLVNRARLQEIMAQALPEAGRKSA